MLVCPSCKSTRIRNDYVPAPFFLRILGIRKLLCDYCNRQFKAFSPLPPKSHRSRRKLSGSPSGQEAPPVVLSELRENLAEAQSEKAGSLDRIKLSLQTAPTGEVVTGQILPIEGELQTQILKLHAQRAEKDGEDEMASPGQASKSAPPACPECGSKKTKRRQRTMFERAALSVSDRKAFTCRSCNHSFYSKLNEEENTAAGAEAGMLGSSELRAETES